MILRCRMIRGIQFWYACIAAGILSGAALSAQTLPEMIDALDGVPPAGGGGESAAAAIPGAPPPGEEGSPVLPRSFRGFSLGMDPEELKSALREDELLRFRGDRDVSFLPVREQSLVETTGFSFIRRAFFQLRGDELFIMAFSLDPGLIDHYSVYTSFVRKYGEPKFIDPKQAVWESGDTRVSIERPLTVKYIDMRVFNEVIAESETRQSKEMLLREEFLDDF
jgi:hypothetical protein